MSPLERIADVATPCLHPEHKPRSGIPLTPGVYRYTCPGCGAAFIFASHPAARAEVTRRDAVDAENERLRAALEQIDSTRYSSDAQKVFGVFDVAAAALHWQEPPA